MGQQAVFREGQRMGNKVDISEMENFSNDLKEASADIKASLAQVEEKIEQVNNMKSFSGKAAKSAKQYFGEMHLTVLASFKGLFEDLEENLQQHIKTFESMVDSSDSAVIRSDYLQDVKEDINETFETLQKQDEIISETIEDVSDISSATSPSFSEVDEWKKKAVKKINELDEDLDSFTSEGDEVDVQKVMQQIETVMKNAKASEGKARFTDFEGASQGSNLAKLQAYNFEKAEDEAQEIEELDHESQLYLQQAYEDYEAGDIDKATYEAILSRLLQSGSSFVAYANKGKFSNSVSKDVQEDIGQWVDNLYEKQEKAEENQEFYQDMVGQGNVEGEEEQLLAFMGEVEKGNIDIDEVSVYDNDFPEEEPIDFWDKRKVAGGNSPLAGTPDGLAGPASATFDFIKKPINLSKHAEKSEAVIDKLPDEIAGPASTRLDASKGVDDGVERVEDDILVGAATTIGHPIETAKALWNAATNPRETFHVMSDAISTSYDRDVTNGNAESRSRWFTYAATTIGTSFIGASGPNAVSRAGSSAARTTTKPVAKNTNRININNPFEFKPALNA